MLMTTRESTPEEIARAEQRQDTDDLLNKALVAYRQQMEFAISLYTQSDAFMAESPATRDAVFVALRKVARTMTLCGVQPIVQFHEKAVGNLASELTLRSITVRNLTEANTVLIETNTRLHGVINELSRRAS